jgi:hypothetical protein
MQINYLKEINKHIFPIHNKTNTVAGLMNTYINHTRRSNKNKILNLSMSNVPPISITPLGILNVQRCKKSKVC